MKYDYKRNRAPCDDCDVSFNVSLFPFRGNCTTTGTCALRNFDAQRLKYRPGIKEPRDRENAFDETRFSPLDFCPRNGMGKL